MTAAPSTSSTVRRHVFRADIQALRALAVGLVLLNHLWPDHLSGGYIGVDIFFVISGFLITSQLKREVDSTGTVKLARFWSRRAKRLLPAAILVLIASAMITAWTVPVTSARAAYTQIGAAGAYVLNWVLSAASLDYFAHSVLSPVTHYWSLSVEEQFYAVWPLLILLGLLLSRSHSARIRHWMMFGTLCLVFVGSLALAVWSVQTVRNAAYFQTTGRAWEFAAGGLIALLPAKEWRSSRAKVLASWTLCAVVLVCAVTYGPATGFPGPAALVPIAATAVLIWFGDGGSPLSPQRVFAVRPVQFMGDISYSLYLWHWPLIVAATFLTGHLTALAKVGILAVTFLLSWLTKRYVEDTVRFAKGPVLGKPGRVLVVTAAAVAIVLGGTTAASANIGNRARTAAEHLYAQSLHPGECFGAGATLRGADCLTGHRLANPDSLLIAADNQRPGISNGSVCLQPRGASTVANCSFGVANGTQSLNVALVGDSHAGMWAPALSRIAVKSGMRVTTYLEAVCAATADPGVVYGPDRTTAAGCRAWRKQVIDKIAADPTIDVVITSSNDRNYVTESTGATDPGDGYVTAWREWLAAGKRVVAINDVPQHPSFVPDCIARSSTSIDPCAIPIAPFVSPSPLGVAATKIHNPRFSYLDFQDIMCDNVCHSVIGGIPAYVDSDHLSASFVRSFVPGILNAQVILGSTS